MYIHDGFLNIMKKLSILLIFVVLISLVTSCNKQNKEYLLGDWDLISKPNEDVHYVWSFTETKVAVMATDADENSIATGELDTCAYGSYILKNGVLTMALPAVACRGSVFSGDWDVQNLTDQYMTIRLETASGSHWYEFKKQI